eukprot:CAMPEP_0204915470 /NCGR_PEP_ID=MMETSP1397-20131031/13467_1 /ASSEMBLY_ACC=CAM_ASM_000891 /TAXON_ID=49980 /ORGANISM="Climacostomum Climacostomum virens, Strain Stock W-24" /LENGTH=49 /DNA_ID= /DNA_START= /DNA_END= /DNA_ORIENTATION=
MTTLRRSSSSPDPSCPGVNLNEQQLVATGVPNTITNGEKVFYHDRVIYV